MYVTIVSVKCNGLSHPSRYLTDPDEEWMEEDGGVLELYPIDPASAIDMGPGIGVQGVPTAAPTGSIVPKFNTMAFFVVQPGRSYHSVQEVFADKPRVSISGWYHGTSPPKGSDMASLGQIMKKNEDHRPFRSIPVASTAETTGEAPRKKSKKSKKSSKAATFSYLQADDLILLRDWINPEYLKESVMGEINDAFCAESSMQVSHSRL